MNDVSVARHRVELSAPAVGGFDSGDLTVAGTDARDRTLEANLPAKLLEQTHHGVDQRSGTSHREVDAPAALESVNQSVDRRGNERVATDQ